MDFETLEQIPSTEPTLDRIVATVEGPSLADIAAQAAEFATRLAAAESRLAELESRAAAASVSASAAPGRKTLAASAQTLLAKHGLAADSIHAGAALDAALVHLSLEQRIAVKSELLRAGVLG